MGDNKNIKNGQINIELDEETAQGIYSNLAIITHSSSEFVLDFVIWDFEIIWCLEFVIWNFTKNAPSIGFAVITP